MPRLIPSRKTILPNVTLYILVHSYKGLRLTGLYLDTGPKLKKFDL